MYCPDCGKQTAAGRRFCVHCGADIGGALTPPPVPISSRPTDAARTIGDLETRLGQQQLEILIPGALIADRYEIRKPLGQGGMGVVYQVHDRTLGSDCALKVMHPHLLANERAVQRFVEEARISLGLLHSNIIRVRDIGQWDGLRYLTMELLVGRPVRTWLRELSQRGERAPIDVVGTIVGQVLDALAYAHERRTVHRDIKPENIFLEDHPPSIRATILDFGIAGAMDRKQMTTTRMAMGTAWYMAPEQREAAAEVDARSDIFSLGVVLHELLTGTIPAGRFALPSEKRKDLVANWDDLVLRAIEEDPAERHESALEMARALQGCIEAQAKEDVSRDSPEVKDAAGGDTPRVVRRLFRVVDSKVPRIHAAADQIRQMPPGSGTPGRSGKASRLWSIRRWQLGKLPRSVRGLIGVFAGLLVHNVSLFGGGGPAYYLLEHEITEGYGLGGLVFLSFIAGIAAGWLSRLLWGRHVSFVARSILVIIILVEVGAWGLSIDIYESVEAVIFGAVELSASSGLGVFVGWQRFGNDPEVTEIGGSP